MVDIYDWNDLDDVRNDLAGDYVLQNDLDSSTTGYSGIGDDWTPLGFDSGDAGGNPFSGTLNGQGFQISDLVIEENSGNGGVAFITRVDDGGLVQKLEVDGTVDSTSSGRRFAGLVGTIGVNGTDAGVVNCASHIDVTASSGTRVAGLVAFIDSGSNNRVANCYSTGSVTGDDEVGGLVGENYGNIFSSYAVGSVTGNTNVGALVGANEFAVETSDSYADEQTTGQTNLTGDGLGPTTNSRTLTTSAMQGDEAPNSGNMDGFDYTNVWDTVLTEDSDTTADGYPILQALNREGQLQAQGILIPPNPIIVDGTKYDCLVDGTQYSAELQ